MKKTNFDELLARYLEGNVTPEEKKKLEAWLEMRKTRNTTETELSEEDEERLFQKITSRITTVPEVENFLSGSKKSSRTPLLAIAASLLILIACVVVWRTAVHEEEITKMIFNDGTIVWASQGSKAVYYEKDNTRFCSLTGDALFEVAKDASRPFVLHVRDVDIRVVGTSFRVESRDENIELNVLTGNVELINAKGETRTVAAREKVVVAAQGIAANENLNAGEIDDLVRGSEYDMKFNNASLADVLERIEKKFNTVIELEDRRAGECRITADFTDRSLESTLGMISEVLDIRHEVKGNTMTISGPGCQ